MGNITIRIPQPIRIEYDIRNRLMPQRLLDVLNPLLFRSVTTQGDSGNALRRRRCR